MSNEPEHHTLADWRVVRDLTQQELANLAGVHVSTISNIEYRGTSPTPEIRESIAEALGVAVEQIAWPPPKSRRSRRRGPLLKQGTADNGDMDDPDDDEGELPKGAARADARGEAHAAGLPFYDVTTPRANWSSSALTRMTARGSMSPLGRPLPYWGSRRTHSPAGYARD